MTIDLGNGVFTEVDEEDFENLKKYRWTALVQGRLKKRAYSYQLKKYLHRFLLDAPEGLTVDHIDGDPLNNKKANLRLATQQQNCSNSQKPRTRKFTSIYKGVYYDKSMNTKNKWRAAIRVNFRKISLGRFPNERKAAEAYNRAAILYFGDFASLNKIKE